MRRMGVGTVIALILLGGALAIGAMWLLRPDPYRAQQVEAGGQEIHFRVVRLQDRPPKEFLAVVVVQPVAGRLPRPAQLLRVVRQVADQSLMRIGTVQQWWISLVLAGEEGARPFAVYSYRLSGDRLRVRWQPEALPAGMRAGLPRGEQDLGGGS
jgi:hypothetical protein